VKPEVAAETYQSISGGDKPDATYPTKFTDVTARRKSRKRRRVIVPESNGESSSEGLSAPDTHFKLKKKGLKDSQLDIPVELGGSVSTSKNGISATATPRAVVDAGLQQSR